MKTNKFKFLFAYRNINSNKKSSLVIILTLSLIFCLMMLLFGMKFTFSKIYELQAVDTYNQIDIVMTYDEYSSSRLINKREVNDEYADYIYYSMSFFNLDVLAEGTDIFYTKMMSSLPHEFEYLVDKDVLIKDNEIIITKTLSEKHNLQIGDTFSFYVFDDVLDYTVGDIFPDEGLFSGLTFYMDKEELLQAIYGINLTNFGNTLYLDINDDYSINEVIEALNNNDDFSDYNIFPTVNWDYIESRAMDLVSMMLSVGLIVVLAIFMVLDSLFPMISKDISQQQGVVSILGGEKKFIWHVSLIQWLVYTAISFIFGIILALVVINLGLHVYGINGLIPLKFLPTLLSLLVVLLYVILRAYISYRKEYKKSSVSLSSSKRYKLYHTKGLNIIIAAVLLLVEYVFVFFELKIHATIIVFLSVYLSFNVLSYLVVILSNLIRKTKRKSLFTIFQLKYLKDNKHLHQSLRVVLICLITIVMIFSVRTFISSEINEFYGIMDYDLTIANVYDYDDALKTEIEEYDVVSVDEAVFYQNIYVHFNETDSQPCKFFVSMEQDRIENYFGIEELDFDESYLNNEVAYVLLPKNYGIVYNLEVGDTVTVDLNYNLKNIDVKIAGFLDMNFDNFIFSNIAYLPQYEELAIPNALFINTDNKEQLFNDLITDYSSKMYYVLDPDVYFEEMIQGAIRITDFFSVFTSFMIICFIIVIFNNTLLVFYSLKNELAKIKVLGANRGDFIKTLLKEYFLILIIILGVGFLEVVILSENMKYMVLLTNYYKDITSTPLTIIYGCVIVSLVLLLSYIYYFINIYKTDIIDEIKIY
ncbi:MAG: ABC transporter permease [Tenericutes bacterium]|nr:ABC transporter permease [Mycoplasmatota bacterium]